MRFQAAQRAQAQPREFVLQLAHIVPADCKVMDEVVGALTHRGCRGIELGRELLLGRQRRTAQFIDAARGTVEAQRSGNLALSASLGSHRGPASVSRGNGLPEWLAVSALADITLSAVD